MSNITHCVACWQQSEVDFVTFISDLTKNAKNCIPKLIYIPGNINLFRCCIPSINEVIFLQMNRQPQDIIGR